MRFRRKLLSLLTLVVFIFSTSNSFAELDYDKLYSGDYRIIIDNKVLTLDSKPVVEKSRLLVPMRAIFEALGASIDWNPASKTVTGTKGEITVVLKINSQDAYINDKLYKLDVPPIIKSKRTLVPVRFVAESLNMDVSWNITDKSVIINSGMVSVEPTPTPTTSAVTPTPTITPTSTLPIKNDSSDPLSKLYKRLWESNEFNEMTFNPSTVVHDTFNSDEIYTELFEVMTCRAFINHINSNFENESLIYAKSPGKNNIKNMSSYLRDDCKFYEGKFEVVSEVNIGVVSIGAVYKATLILADKFDPNKQYEKYSYYVATYRDEKPRDWYVYDCELISVEK